MKASISTNFDRRGFLSASSLGLAAAGMSALALRADAATTPASGEDHGYREFLVSVGESEASPIEIPAPELPGKFAATEDNILGPYYRPGAPFRGKVTPPLE